MQAQAFRDTGHGLAGVPVDGRTLAAARLAHKLATLASPAPGAWTYLEARNVAQVGAQAAQDPAQGWTRRLVAAFGVTL